MGMCLTSHEYFATLQAPEQKVEPKLTVQVAVRPICFCGWHMRLDENGGAAFVCDNQACTMRHKRWKVPTLDLEPES